METETKKIVYSEYATKAIHNLLDSISLDSEQAAERIQIEIVNFISNIKKKPTSFPVCSEIPTKNNSYRYARFYQYKIIFKISAKSILILDVFHSKRNPKRIKKLKSVK